VFLKSQMPAAIIETVFTTNPHEVALLSGGTGRLQRIAERLEAGIMNYIGPP
jgi:N-acetylmuramoyl-L-alanine amidase